MLTYRIIYWMNKKGMFDAFKLMVDNKALSYALLSLYFSYWFFLLDILNVFSVASPFLAIFWPILLTWAFSKNIMTFFLIILPIFLFPTLVSIDSFTESEFRLHISVPNDFESFVNDNIYLILIDIYVIFGVVLKSLLYFFEMIPRVRFLEIPFQVISSGLIWPTEIILSSPEISIFSILITVVSLTAYYMRFYQNQFGIKLLPVTN